MKLSTRTRYGTRAVLDLAMHHGEGPIFVKDIARRQGISKKYLDHIITALKAAGLVKSFRGAHGGYILAKDPASIKLSDVVQALEGPLTPVDCVDDPSMCPRSPYCVTIEVWADVKRAIFEVLNSLTLQDLVERQGRKGMGYGI
ncbi:MAG TPA: Rrf2 family transcriptional regulator [Candidatus Latescibacteria bacterium]|nr:Rrf2 family transcriptional regulator [Candidatus Latescibacterota bacterium]